MAPRVLIVEDEPDVLLVLRINLEAAGFETCLAADGVTALRRIEDDRPDVVLLDLMLPVVDGWAVLAELRSREDPTPVLVCSAKRTPRDLARAEELGAVGYVAKPFETEDVVARVTQVVREAHPHLLPQLDLETPTVGTVGLDVEPA
jgi:two-component system alkaline phosphatase synthesis response regulator PhoP